MKTFTVQRLPALLAAALCGLILLDGLRLAAQAGISQSPRPRFRERRASPDVHCHQGYATGGGYHYTIDTAAIYQRAQDEKWTLIASNTAPFTGVKGITHLGDGDYHAGKLYIVGEQWNGCDNVHNQSILIYDATNLKLLGATNISAQGHEVSGLVIVPEDGRHGIIYVCSYCDGSQIFKYDLENFDYLGVLPLSGDIPQIQGIAYDRGTFYAASDGGGLYAFTRAGQVTMVYFDKHGGSHEGLKHIGSGIEWLIDEGPGKQRVHFLAPVW